MSIKKKSLLNNGKKKKNTHTHTHTKESKRKKNTGQTCPVNPKKKEKRRKGKQRLGKKKASNGKKILKKKLWRKATWMKLMCNYTWAFLSSKNDIQFLITFFSPFWGKNFLMGPKRKYLGPTIYFPSFPPN